VSPAYQTLPLSAFIGGRIIFAANGTGMASKPQNQLGHHMIVASAEILRRVR